jgi:mannitol/fructose-specific phosphotransferase system IIA component (Ntr-type)
MRISENLKPEAITTDLEGGSVNEVISELAMLLAGKQGESEANSIREALIRREELLSTAMGAGIAFPHCTSPDVNSPRFALGISRRGVEADSPDNKPVNIFFAVVSPEKDPNAHLDALAAASKVFINADSRDKVLGAGSAEEAIAAIAEAEEV